EQSANNSGVGEDLQIIVVGLLKPVQSVAGIVAGINHAERTQSRSDQRMMFDYIQGHIPEVGATRGGIGGVNRPQQTIEDTWTANPNRTQKQQNGKGHAHSGAQ